MDPTVKSKLKKWVFINWHPYKQKYVKHIRSLECVKIIHFKKISIIIIIFKIIIKLFSHIFQTIFLKE